MNLATRFMDVTAFADLVQIVGLIRFSYPSVGGFQQAFTCRKMQQRMLFSRARMMERFKYFESLCLHSLKQQTEKNFTIGVLAGEEMPAEYRDKLEHLLAGLPQARLVVLPSLPYQDAVRQAYESLFDPGAPFRLSFRLDDDDAVAVDFIEQVNAKIPQLLALSGGMDPVGLSFLKGITLFGPPQARRLVPAVDACPLGVGLCVLAPQSRPQNALMFAHQKLHMNMPIIMDPYPVMNLRSFHASNDSRVLLPPGRAIEIGQKEMPKVLQQRFGLDMDRVLAL